MLEGLQADLNSVSSPWGIVLLILNIVWPGLGTIINSFMGDKVHCTSLLVGVFQMLLAWIIIGWIWSIWWGIIIFQKQK